MFRTKHPDIKMLENLVAQWQDRLFRFAYMRVGNREDAEDLVQDVFISLYDKFRKTNEIRDVGSYLFRSLYNACISYKRKYQPQKVPLDELSDLPADDQDYEMRCEYVRLMRLLQGLPKEQAEVLRMKCYDGLTFREIAEIEGIPEPTAKSRYRYAVQALQIKLKNDKYD